ncbi:MAG: cupin domain-containing protein [Candidatus Binatia bacterium]
MTRVIVAVCVAVGIFISVVVMTGLSGPVQNEEAHPGNKVLYHQALPPLPRGNHKLGVWLSRWKPGEVTPLHFHHGPGVLCVLEGQLRIRIPSQGEVTVNPGNCWEETPGVAHSPLNPGRRDARAVFVLIHPVDKPLREDVK